MKHLIMGIVGLVVLMGQWGMVAYAQPLVISSFSESNPMVWVCKDVMTEAYRRIGRTMEVKYFPAERALVTANDGDVDGELGRPKGMTQAYPNLRQIPIVLAVTEIVVFTKEKTFPVDGWNSLLPYRVGYVRGIKDVEKNLVEGTNAEAVTTMEQAFKKLEIGRSDVVIEARLPGLKTLKELALTGIIVLGPPLKQGEMFHYLHVKNQHLVEPLTAALQQMEKEGVIQQIQQQVEQAIQSPSK